MVPSVSRQLEPEVANSKYYLIRSIAFLVYLTITVNDGEYIPSAHAAIDSEESLYHSSTTTQMHSQSWNLPERKPMKENGRKPHQLVL